MRFIFFSGVHPLQRLAVLIVSSDFVLHLFDCATCRYHHVLLSALFRFGTELRMRVLFTLMYLLLVVDQQRRGLTAPFAP